MRFQKIILLILACGVSGFVSSAPATKDAIITQRVVLPPQDTATVSQIAAEVALVLPSVTKFKKFPQVRELRTGSRFVTGVVATAQRNAVEVAYRNVYQIPGATPTATTTMATLEVVSVEGSKNVFEIRSSALIENLGRGQLGIATDPLAPIDGVANDLKRSLAIAVDALVLSHEMRAEAAALQRAKDAKESALVQAQVEAAAMARTADRERREREAVWFRKRIVLGTETNCGPVIDLKADLLKIYHPVPNFGNEHWLRRDQVYAPQVGCRFENGKYVIPE